MSERLTEWTDLDELEFQMGDMNGIAFQEAKSNKGPKPPKGGSKPKETSGTGKQDSKKHITKTGK